MIDGKPAAFIFSSLFGGFLFAILSWAPLAWAEDVDLELVIATDVSHSIDEDEALLQRQGVAAAFRSEEVIDAIQGGSLGKIGVAYVDWSIDAFNKIVIDWLVIEDEESAEAFARALLDTPPSYGQRTSISGLISLAVQMLETNDLEGNYRTIDISGDGPNNAGLPLAVIRDKAIAEGVTINGLPILTEDAQYRGRGYFPDIDKYYVACVIGGRASFALPARGFQDFAAAIRRKLILEISGVLPQSQFAEIRPASPPLIRMTADMRTAQARPTPVRPPTVLRAPPAREQNCDRFGFGGYGGFGGFGQPDFNR